MASHEERLSSGTKRDAGNSCLLNAGALRALYILADRAETGDFDQPQDFDYGGLLERCSLFYWYKMIQCSRVSSTVNSPNLVEHHCSNLPLQLRLSKHIPDQPSSHISPQHYHIATVLIANRQQAASRVQAKVPWEESVSRPGLHEAELSRITEREGSDGVRGNGGAVR